MIHASQAFRGIGFLSAVTIVAEAGNLQRFASAPQFMAYAGVVPCEVSSGTKQHRGPITRTGNSLLRHVFGEAAHHVRHAPRVGGTLKQREADLPQPIVDLAWRAQLGLHHRYRRLGSRHRAAQVEAFRAFGGARYALAVPYLAEVRDAIAATYSREGFTAVSSAYLGISKNAAFAEVPRDTIVDLVRRSDSPQAQAVAIICTNLPAAWLVEELEAALDKPVFDSTVITVWRALRLAGFEGPLHGWGRLLREPVGVRL